MSLPVYKVEVWEPGAGSALYSLTSDVNNIYSKESLTDAIGYFTLQLLTKKDAATYYYNDIDIHDIVKIWIGWDTVAGDPTFMGRVGKITAPLTTEQGYVRVISGPSQGEILQRRFKTNKIWTATDASQIATDVATDLGILHAADIDTDTNDITLEVVTKSYFDILREISDFWYDATHKVQKDFWVHTDGHLHWKARPVRTAGVETFTVGTNILNYIVTQFVDPVKNNIKIYGINTETNPANMDTWTETTTGWDSAGMGGTITLDNAQYVVGSYSVKNTLATTTAIYLRYALSSAVSLTYEKEPKSFHCWLRATASAEDSAHFLVILTTSSGNYFSKYISKPQLNKWNEYDFVAGPGSDWFVNGSPDWNNINWIQFVYVNGTTSANLTLNAEGVYFGKARYSGSASDLVGAGSSGVLYGQRDLELIDNRLTSDSDCAKRAETILLTNKSLPKQVEVSVIGNTNVLIGDRVLLTIPAENISAVLFDIVTVEHQFPTEHGFDTKATMLNSLNTRQLLEVQPIQAIANLKRDMRELIFDAKRL